MQTATLDTGDIFMTINNFQANESVLVQYPGKVACLKDFFGGETRLALVYFGLI